jgi:magnesium chelatase subunit D
VVEVLHFALAIHRAGQFLEDIKRHGHTPTMILITDARANVSLAGLGGREKAFTDATQVAQTFRIRGIRSILIDTAIMPQDNAKAIANSLGSVYVPLPMGRADKVVQVTKQFSN